MKLPNIRPGSIPGKYVVSSLAGLAVASIMGFALINASQTASTPTAQTSPRADSAPTESQGGYKNTIEITREEALARFGEDAQRKRALEESRRIKSISAAQLVFLDENGNRIPGRIQDIPGAAPRRTPRGPLITWPGDGPGAGIVADTSHIRSYTYVTRNSDGQLEKDYVTGTREDAERALKVKRESQSRTHEQTDAQESKVQ